MAPKLFLTGVTGFIGGDGLYAIYNAHPDWDYTALVRSSDKGALVAKEYPSIRLVYGDLASGDLLEAEAKRADIVLHFANADDKASAEAIAKGLSAHSSSSPGYWIHTSGTGILLFHDLDRGVFGEENPKIYDDLADIGEIVNLPDHAPHRQIDKLVQQAASASVKTAIVSPPAIYDRGRGPGNQRSIQVPDLARAIIDRGEAFYVGKGKAIWGNVNVRDLSDLYLLLAEDAAAGTGKAGWGPTAYYFAENGEYALGDVSKLLGGHLYRKNMVKSPEAVSVSAEDTARMLAFGPAGWGANSRSRASRARKYLAWSPKARSVEDTLELACDDEIKAAGK